MCLALLVDAAGMALKTPALAHPAAVGGPSNNTDLDQKGHIVINGLNSDLPGPTALQVFGKATSK